MERGHSIRFLIPSRMSAGADTTRTSAVATWLAGATGVHVDIEEVASDAALAHAVTEQSHSLAWLPPVSVTRALRRGCSDGLTLVRDGVSTYRAGLWMREGGILGDAKRAAWVDPSSMAGFLLPRATMWAEGVEPDVHLARQYFTGGYDDCVSMLLAGDVDVIGAPIDARGQFAVGVPPRGVHCVAHSPSVPNDALVFSPKMPQALRARLEHVLLQARVGTDADALFALLQCTGFERLDGTYMPAVEAIVLANAGLDSAPHPCGRCAFPVRLSDRFCARCGHELGAQLERSASRRLDVGALRGATRDRRDEWSEERKVATVLFGDIAGFTAISSQLEPDAVREFANLCFGPLAREVEDRGGTVVKYIGDCIMAVFGVPRASESDPTRAVDAALAMSARLDRISMDVEARYGAPVSMRIGVATGSVMVGSVGEGRSAAKDIMGATVNLASRLEGQARPGQVVVCHRTHRVAQRSFASEPLGPLALKGLEKPEHAFAMTLGEAQADPDHLGDAAAIREKAPFVRTAALTTIQRTFGEVVLSRDSRVIALLSQPGMGKREVLTRASSWLQSHESAPIILSANAFTSSRSDADDLQIVGQMVRDRFDIRPGEEQASARTRVQQGVEEAWGVLDRDAGRDAGTVLARVAGLGPDDAVNVLEYDRVYRTFVAWVRQMAIRQPVVAVLHGMQWASRGWRQASEDFVEATRGVPVLNIVTAWPSFDQQSPTWGERGRPKVKITLEPLARAEMRGLLRHLLQDVDGLPAGVMDTLVARAEGNPELAKELAWLLVDMEFVQRVEDRWVWCGDGREIVFPPSLQGAHQARIDALRANERAALRHFAVVGPRFERGAAIASMEAHLVDAAAAALDRVRQRGLVQSYHVDADSALDMFEFTSLGLQELAYRGLPGRARAAAHRRVAAWLEKGHHRQGEARVASHWERGERPARARPWLIRAGWHALGAYALDEAEQFLLRAERSGEAADPRGRADSARLKARIAAHRGQLDDALDVLLEGRGFIADTGGALVALIDVERAEIMREAGLHDRAIDVASSLADDLSAPAELRVRAMVVRGASRRNAGDDAGALVDAEAAADLVATLPTRSPATSKAAAVSFDLRGSLYARAGELDAAASAFRHALTYRRMAGEPSSATVYSLTNLGAVAVLNGRWSHAERAFRQAIRIARAANDTRIIAAASNNLGDVLKARGLLEDALRAYEESLEASIPAGLMNYVVIARCAVVDVLIELGRFEDAAVRGEEGLALVDRIGSGPRQAWARVGLVEAYSHVENAGERIQSLQERLTELVDEPELSAQLRSRVHRALVLRGRVSPVT